MGQESPQWETLQVILSQIRETDIATTGIVAEVIQPVFPSKTEGLPGERGEPRLSVTLKRAPKRGLKEYTLQFFCPNNDLFSEMDSVQQLMAELMAKKDECIRVLKLRQKKWNEDRIKAHDELTERNKKKMKREGNRGVGSGLAQWTNGSKTERDRPKPKHPKQTPPPKNKKK